MIGVNLNHVSKRGPEPGTITVVHYDDVIMTMLASQITSLTVVYSIVYSGVNQRKHQSSASLAFVREIHRGPVNFPHKWPVTRKMFPFDDIIMNITQWAVNIMNSKIYNTSIDNIKSGINGANLTTVAASAVAPQWGEISQYHGCRCPGPLRHQDISSLGIDCVVWTSHLLGTIATMLYTYRPTSNISRTLVGK